MSDYMPKCATCEHFESCIIQKHLTEMALILWNISKAEDKADRKTEPQTIRCPKCGRSDYIREFGKDFSVTAEEAGFKYKCINCNTYIEPQSDRKTENSSEIPNSCKDEPQKKEVEWVYNKRERLWYPYSNGELLFKDEPTTQTETQNSNLTFEKADERCKGCKHYKLTCDLFSEICKYEPKTEPQTENPCDGCVCDDGKHLMYCMNCKGIAWKTEPPKVEDEPQMERSE